MFTAAKPIWIAGREKEMNLQCGFRAVVRARAGEATLLRVTASSVYRAFCNGVFLGYGPARAAHGWMRVDEWTVPVHDEDVVIAIEAAGYNCNSYYLIDQPSFVQAEVVSAAGDLLAATGEQGDFSAHVITSRVQRVQRYSFQRPFAEAYKLNENSDSWRALDGHSVPSEDISEQPNIPLLPRGVSYPRFTVRPFVRAVARCEMARSEASLWNDRSLSEIGPQLKGYKISDLACGISSEVAALQTVSIVPVAEGDSSVAELELSEGLATIIDIGLNRTGFIGAALSCDSPARLAITFDEILVEGNVDPFRLSCVNAILLDLEAGSFDFESFEPCTLRYAKLCVLSGRCKVRHPYLREYAADDVWEAQFASSDRNLNRLFDAGRETYRQNAADIFMDCPQRERGAWLCDSFFTARSAYLLTGSARAERVFLENYLLPDSFDHLPGGMVPMCYPADHLDRIFIPQWALWLILQLGEYLQRSGDFELTRSFRTRVLGILEYLERFKNEDGLLERLEGWQFIEWSAANDFVRDVNYPSNMLWAKAMDVASTLYDIPQLSEQAAAVRETIRTQSFDGKFFVDNAVRVQGKLQVTSNRSEACQYYAFTCGVATPSAYPALWTTLLQKFGPDRAEIGACPEIHAANAFIGNYLRLDLLARYGQTQQLLNETTGYLLYMVDRTGTLWEHSDTSASCIHGFASHIVHWLMGKVLGVQRISDHVVYVNVPELDMEWCNGQLPTTSGLINAEWWREAGRTYFRIRAPAECEIVISPESTAVRVY